MSFKNIATMLFIVTASSLGSLFHFFYFSDYTVQFMVSLGIVYVMWTTWHFGVQAQGLFRFFSYNEKKLKFRRLEAYFLGFTYFFALPYAWLVNKFRFAAILPFEFPESPLHIPTIITITLLQIIAYIVLVKKENCHFSWGHYLAIYYMVAPICIAQTPHNFFLVSYFVYLLPHHLTEIFFQSYIFKGIVKASRTPLKTSAGILTLLEICVAILYFCYDFRSVSTVSSEGQIDWRRFGHAHIGAHMAMCFFLTSSLLHFYVDGIIFRFRDEKIRKKVLPMLVGP